MTTKFCSLLLACSVFFVASPVTLAFGAGQYLSLEKDLAQYAYISDADQAGLDLNSDFTIEAWIKLESMPDGVPMTIVDKAPTFSEGGYRLILGDHLSNKLRVYYWNDSAKDSQIESLSDFVTTSDVGKWIHIAVAVDVSEKTADIYKNGVPLPTGEHGAMAATSVDGGVNSFAVGAVHVDTNASWFFDGAIDNLRVWDEIKTHGEILNNMNSEILSNTNNLISYWKFNGNYLDETINDNDFVQINSPVFEGEPITKVEDIIDLHNNNDLSSVKPLVLREGKVGLASDFEKDNSDSLFVEDSHQNGLDISEDMSISGWFKFEEPLLNNDRYGIVFKDAGQPDRSYGYYLRDINGQNGVGMYNSEDGTNNNTTNNKLIPYAGNFQSGEWYFIVWVFDASEGQLEAFVDGKSIGIVGGLRNAVNDSEANFKVSGWQDGFGGYYDGLIDELGIWNKTLSSNEILSLYSNGNGIDYTSISDKTGLVSYWSFEIEPVEKSYEDLVGELLEKVETEVAEKPLYQSYIAHVKNLLPFHEKFNLEAARNQIKVLLGKFSRDVEKSDLEASLGEDLIDLGTQIDEALKEEMSQSQGVPLMTQIASPYSPGSDDWEHDPLGSGATYRCGNTIGQCGCAITSLAMVGRGFGVLTGIDGAEVNPRNFNNWLRENDGYDANDDLNWLTALEYFADSAGESHIVTPLNYEYDNEKIAKAIETGGLAVGYESRVGHFITLTEALGGGVFSVLDPLWYETKTTDDFKDIAGHVQDYGGDVDKARLFSWSKEPKPLARGIEIHLASPAELLLVDGQGRKTGYDPNTGEFLNEIPGSSYDRTEVVLSQEDVVGPVHYKKVLFVSRPQDDLYTLEVIGTGEGSYDLTVVTTGGRLASEVTNYIGETELSDVDTYFIDVPDENKTSHAVERLRELADNKEADQPEVAIRLREIADRLENNNLEEVDQTVADLLLE